MGLVIIVALPLSLVQVMACPLLDAKPLPEPMLTYQQLDPHEQSLVKFDWNTFLLKEMSLKMLSTVQN